MIEQARGMQRFAPFDQDRDHGDAKRSQELERTGRAQREASHSGHEQQRDARGHDSERDARLEGLTAERRGTRPYDYQEQCARPEQP